MDTKRGTMSWGATAALAALIGTAYGCGTEEDAPSADVSTRSSDLLSHVAYVPWQTLLAKVGTAGDATIFGSNAYFAYVRPDSTIGIIFDSNLGSSGQNPSTYAIPQKPDYGVALLAFNGTLYLFYSTAQQPIMQRSTDGLNWDGPWQLDPSGGDQLVGPPAAVAYNSHPIVFYPEANCCGSPFIVQFSIWSGTTGERHVPGALSACYSSYRPSTTVWQGNMYLAFADNQASNQIGIVHYVNGGWTGETLTGKTGIPGIFPVSNGTLEMVHHSLSDAHLYKTFSSNGVAFGPSQEDTASTTLRAAVPFLNTGPSSNWTFYIGTDNKLYTTIE
jgi:hypothetical protein